MVLAKLAFGNHSSRSPLISITKRSPPTNQQNQTAIAPNPQSDRQKYQHSHYTSDRPSTNQQHQTAIA